MKRRSKWKIVKKVLFYTFVLAAVAGISVTAFIYFVEKDSKDNSSQQAQTEAPAEPQQQGEASQLTETYDSSLLRLSFMHPSDWTVNEVDRGITLLSPAFPYTDKAGNEVNGKFKIYIRKGARSVDGNYLGKGFALKSSEKISYSEPVPGQREDTFLTVFGLDKPDNFAYFIIQGNIELDEGETLGPDFAKEPDAYLIFGGYTSDEQQDDLSTNILDLDDYEQTGQYKTAVEIVKSLELR